MFSTFWRTWNLQWFAFSSFFIASLLMILPLKPYEKDQTNFDWHLMESIFDHYKVFC